MLDTAEQIHAPELASYTTSETPQADSPSQDESVLTDQIVQLWQIHVDFRASIKNETQKFRSLRDELGRHLSEMKQVLARPGRSGQWSSFLKEHKIPRATADRLVQKHERSLRPHTNRLSEAISEPTEQEIQRLLAKVLPKLCRVLRTPQSTYRFLDLVTSVFDGIDRRATEEGLLIVKPSQNAISDAFAGEVVAQPQTGPQPEVELDQELM
jgi:DNA-binding transcriptional MerR regulator